MLAMTADPAPNDAAAAQPAAPSPSAAPTQDVRPAIAAVGLGLAVVVLAGLALGAGRRRSLRSA